MVDTHLMIERSKDAFCRRFEARRGDLTTRMERDDLVKVIDASTFCWADYDISWHRIRRVAEFDARTVVRVASR